MPDPDKQTIALDLDARSARAVFEVLAYVQDFNRGQLRDLMPWREWTDDDVTALRGALGQLGAAINADGAAGAEPA